MSVIIGVFEEELERLNDRVKRYKEELRSLPKGALSLKQRRERSYAYLTFRKKGKVVSQYIGEAGSQAVKDCREKVDLRRKLEKGLREMKADKKALEKVLRARRKK